EVRKPLSQTATVPKVRIHRAMEAHDVRNVCAKCASERGVLRKQEKRVDLKEVRSRELAVENGSQLSRVGEPIRPRRLTDRYLELVGPAWELCLRRDETSMPGGCTGEVR